MTTRKLAVAALIVNGFALSILFFPVQDSLGVSNLPSTHMVQK